MNVRAEEIARFLESTLIGKDREIVTVTPCHEAAEGALCFINNSAYAERIHVAAVYLVPKNKSLPTEEHACAYIPVSNPRLAFAKVTKKLLMTHTTPSGVARSATLGDHVQLGHHVSIGEGCVIGDNVAIGDGTVIHHNVILFRKTVIGAHCHLKSGTVIGEDGFGFDFEQDGTPVRLPHVGNVVLGNHVEIGANCTIARGTFGSTHIASHVKVDDQVHIAHNCRIGEKTIITACVELSGSVTVGTCCWIGPNASIIQKVILGDKVTVGIGAVITQNIETGKKVMGLKAMSLRNLVRLKKHLADHGVDL